jgi:hypothetical protein
MKPWLRTAIALFIGLTAASTAAQQATTITPPAAAPVQTGSSGLQDGIKLHGNWVLDVRNPDGTLVAHSEFKNALRPSGNFALGSLLQGVPLQDFYVTFNEGITFPDPTITPLCAGEAGAGCKVFVPGGFVSRLVRSDLVPGVNAFGTLVKSAPTGSCVLSGSFTVTAPGSSQIRRAITRLVFSQFSDIDLTMATLPTPVPVVQGQIVQFTYTLSFS